MFQWKQLKPTKSPSSRYGHTLVTTINGTVILFGGCTGPREQLVALNDAWAFKNNEWHTISKSPQPLYLHTAVPCGSKMYVFGGSDRTREFDTLYEYDTQTDEWKLIDVKEKPPGRFGHSAVVYKDSIMIVFGGSTYTNFLGDLYEFHISMKQWKSVFSKNTPSPRAYHSAVQFGNYMYVFGGIEGCSRDCVNEMYRYDCVSKAWTFIEQLNMPTDYSYIGVGGHTAMIFKNYMYIFGGYNGDLPGHLNNLERFHLPTQTWEKIKYKRGTEERAYHGAAMKNNEMLIFGGIQDDFGDNIQYDDLWSITVAGQDMQLLMKEFIDVIIETVS
jgi:N-acetylneuraminic acid mutarotase